MKHKDRKAIPFIFLFLSILVVSFTVYGMTGDRYDMVEGILASVFDDTASGGDTYISAYLSHTARAELLRDAFLLLEDEKRMLSDVQEMIGELEEKRAHFIEKVSQRSEVYEANISSFGLEELLGDLRAAGYLEKYRSFFSDDLSRRKRMFFEGYEKARTALFRQSEHHKNRIDELSVFIEDVTRGKYPDEPDVKRAWGLQETEIQYAKRALFFIQQEDYRRAGELIRTIAEGETEEGEVSYVLWAKILEVLDELQSRTEELRTSDPLIDLKMSYLSEDYEQVLRDSGSLEADEYLRPLLSGLTDAARQNIRLDQEISEELELKREIKRLVARAGELEKRGEHVKATELYRKLLIFDLPSHDREFIIGKLYAGAAQSALSNMKRSDNTGAIKLLDDARRLAWEGNSDKAGELYRSLILQYPNSDYIAQALDELTDL